MSNSTIAVEKIPTASFSNIFKFSVSHYKSSRPKKRAIGVWGAPGCAKTALGFAIAASLGYTPDQIGLIRPALQTPVDAVGVPTVTTQTYDLEYLVGTIQTGLTRFAPPEFVHMLATGQIKFLIIDELPDAPMAVQNVWSGAIYDYDIAGVPLHPDLNMFITGNRPEDRSGAGRVQTKIQGRIYQFEMAQSVDDTVQHFIDINLRPDVTAFIHWAGARALYGEDGFQPNDPINASPRQWEEVGNIDDTLPSNLFLLGVRALIPHGLAMEYMGFRETIADLPPINEVLGNPSGAPVSDKTDVCYALVSRLITEITKVDTFQKIMVYVLRLRPEMQTLFINSIRKRLPEVKSTPEYVQWCTANQAYYGATV